MKNDQCPELDLADRGTDSRMDRRDFLKIAGGGIVLFFTIEVPSIPAQQGQARQQGPPGGFNAYLKIGEDGRVSCFTGKIEMGQGPITSLPQMLAEELDVSLDNVDLVMGDTDLCPWDMGTFGSATTRLFGPALRAAGAEARGVMLELASEHLKIPVERLGTDNGIVFDKQNERDRISYARLARERGIERRLAEGAAVKKPSEFKIMGKPVPRRDAREKVTGKARYAADIQLPGMLYAKVLRPPAHGARLIDVDLSEAERVKGIQVIREGDFVAFLHKYPDVAEIALSKVRAKFDEPRSGLDDGNIFDHLLEVAPEGKVVAQNGDLQKGENEATAIVTETYMDG